jgi:hypothetical protein
MCYCTIVLLYYCACFLYCTTHKKEARMRCITKLCGLLKRQKALTAVLLEPIVGVIKCQKPPTAEAVGG